MKNNFWKKFFPTILASFVLFGPILVFATDPTIENPISPKTVTDFIITILEGVIKIGIPIIALALVYCGFLFVAARGNSEKIKTAKDSLIYTLIGAAILLGSLAIAQLINNTILKL